MAMLYGAAFIIPWRSATNSNESNESSTSDMSYEKSDTKSDVENHDSDTLTNEDTDNELDNMSTAHSEEGSTESTSESLSDDEVLKVLVSDKEVSESIKNDINRVLSDNEKELNKNGIALDQAKSGEPHFDSTNTCYIVTVNDYYVFIYLGEDRIGVVKKDYIFGMNEEDTDAEEISTDVWDVIDTNKTTLESYGYAIDDLIDDVSSGKAKMKKTDKDKIYLLTSESYEIQVNANDFTINFYTR